MTSAIDKAQAPALADHSAEAPIVTRNRVSPLRYCLIAFMLPLLAIPALIRLGSSDFFLHHGASVWVQANDKVFDMSGRDCDVVVYGDSTAMTGIDPDLVEEQTGLKTCNIAVTNAVLAVTGNLTLDHFLAHNHRPKILLVQLAPDGFQPGSAVWHQTIYAEGLLEMLRHARPGEARRTLLSHPSEAVSFAGYAAGYTAWYGIKAAWFRTTGHRPEEDKVTVRNGFFTPPTPARTSCEPVQLVADSGNREDGAFSRTVVANFRGTYAGRAGVVLVNVAPIPDCDANAVVYHEELSGVTSNSFQTLPVQDFNNCCHYTQRGSQIVSSLVAEELRTAAGIALPPDAPAQPTRQVASLRRVRLGVRR
jgi:hypothetical protein